MQKNIFSFVFNCSENKHIKLFEKMNLRSSLERSVEIIIPVVKLAFLRLIPVKA